jgi:hypothetical protein
MRLGATAIDAGNVWPVEVVTISTFAALTVVICTSVDCSSDRLAEASGALVKDPTVQVTIEASDAVHTSTALVISSVFSDHVAEKVADELEKSTAVQPTQGVLTKAATLSMDVSILNPVVAVAVTAA